MERKLRMAVVGVGYMGQVHANCIKEVPNAELVAVIDPDEVNGKAIAEKFGCAYIKSVDELADHPEIDAVNICVPEEYHMETAVKCAELGKHIAIEKPLAKTYEEAKAIVEACEKNNVRLLVEHTIHFNDEFKILKNRYDAGAIGKISQIDMLRLSFRDDMDRFKGRVSILYYIAIHYLEAVQWITGYKIVRVLGRRADSMKLFGEEGYSILFELENGALGTMNVGWQLPNETQECMGRIVLIGDKGLIDYDQFRSPIIESPLDRKYSVMIPYWPIDGKLHSPVLNENLHFVDAVLNNKEFSMNTDDAVYILKVLDAVQKSANSGKLEEV